MKAHRFIIRTTTDLLDELRAFALEDSRSVNGEILAILREYIARRKSRKEKKEEV